MKKLLLLLFSSLSLLSQTTCEKAEKNENDLNTISVQKCLAKQSNKDLLKTSIRKINTKTSARRFMKIRNVSKKSKVSSLQNDLSSSGLVTKKANNELEIVSLLAFPKNFEIVETLQTVDLMPQFRTCKGIETKKEMASCFNSEILDFVNENIVYPEEAINAGINGEISIKFIIDRQGKVSNINVTGEKNSRSLKEEVIDLIYNLPKLKPAVKGAESVPVSFEFSLNFTL